MIELHVNGHHLRIQTWSSFGKEAVWYDGHLVSEKRSVTGSTHIFEAHEDNQSIQYEVEVGIRWHGFTFWAVVRRDGRVIFSNR